jgi:hypothetical protein
MDWDEITNINQKTAGNPSVKAGQWRAGSSIESLISWLLAESPVSIANRYGGGEGGDRGEPSLR